MTVDKYFHINRFFIPTKALSCCSWFKLPLNGIASDLLFHSPIVKLAYSVLRLFTGLLIAALMVFKLTTVNARANMTIPTITNSQILMLIR